MEGKRNEMIKDEHKLVVSDLRASIKGKKILNGVSLEVSQGEIVAIMGLNGSGKSTLALAIMGSPNYDIEGGKIELFGQDVTALGPDERAKLGLFLLFQAPPEVLGVTVSSFIKSAMAKKEQISAVEYKKLLHQTMQELRIDEPLAERYLNHGFSGGEKKRSEMLQMSMLKPKIAILDEPDSGLDIDAVKAVAENINKAKKAGTGILLITHYQRILSYAKPDKVHVMIKGNIVKSGGPELAHEIEQKGYDWLEA